MADYIKCSDIDDPKVPIVPPKDPVPGGGLPSGGTTGQVLTKASNADGDVIWADGGGGGGSILAPITATKTVGGVTAGRTFTAGTSYEDIFRAILAPSLTPTLKDPSATLSTTTPTLQESGATVNAILNTTFDRGSINPPYGTSGYRSGAATGYSLNGGTSQTSPNFTVPVSASGSYRVNVGYSAGEQPKDSEGNNYGQPLPAGAVQSNEISFEFVDALWGTTSSITTATKQALISKSVGEYTFALAAQTDNDPAYFDVPASWAVTNVDAWNFFTQKWEDDAWEFDVTDVTHPDAGGNPVVYKRYTDNRGVAAGAREIRIKWR